MNHDHSHYHNFLIILLYFLGRDVEKRPGREVGRERLESEATHDPHPAIFGPPDRSMAHRWRLRQSRREYRDWVCGLRDIPASPELFDPPFRTIRARSEVQREMRNQPRYEQGLLQRENYRSPAFREGRDSFRTIQPLS